MCFAADVLLLLVLMSAILSVPLMDDCAKCMYVSSAERKQGLAVWPLSGVGVDAEYPEKTTEGLRHKS